MCRRRAAVRRCRLFTHTTVRDSAWSAKLGPRDGCDGTRVGARRASERRRRASRVDARDAARANELVSDDRASVDAATRAKDVARTRGWTSTRARARDIARRRGGAKRRDDARGRREQARSAGERDRARGRGRGGRDRRGAGAGVHRFTESAPQQILLREARRIGAGRAERGDDFE